MAEPIDYFIGLTTLGTAILITVITIRQFQRGALEESPWERWAATVLPFDIYY